MLAPLIARLQFSGAKICRWKLLHNHTHLAISLKLSRVLAIDCLLLIYPMIHNVFYYAYKPGYKPLSQVLIIKEYRFGLKTMLASQLEQN